jgi:hypothetical protein
VQNLPWRVAAHLTLLKKTVVHSAKNLRSPRQVCDKTPVATVYPKKRCFFGYFDQKHAENSALQTKSQSAFATHFK